MVVVVLRYRDGACVELMHNGGAVKLQLPCSFLEAGLLTTFFLRVASQKISRAWHVERFGIGRLSPLGGGLRSWFGSSARTVSTLQWVERATMATLTPLCHMRRDPCSFPSCFLW